MIAYEQQLNRKHQGDVQELIDRLKLPAAFASQLSPETRDTFLGILQVLEQYPTEPWPATIS